MNGKTFSATASMPATPALLAISMCVNQDGLSISQQRTDGDQVIEIPTPYVAKFFDALLGILVNREEKG